MFWEIFRFEVRYQLRQPLFWLSALFFFLLTFLAITTDAVTIGGAIGRVHRNAPFVIMQMLLVMSILGIFVTTAFVASTVLRDFDHRTAELFFSTPVKKRDYLLGRFAGALVVAFGAMAPVVLAIVAGSVMPWLEPERIGPFSALPYLFALLVIAIPNLFFSASLVFSLATATRSLMFTYAGVVAAFFGYALAGNLLSDLENEPLASVLDPFGGAALGIATKYWTVAERNARIPTLDGLLVTNRLAWVGIGIVVLAWTYYRFSFTAISSRKSKKKPKRPEEVSPAPEPTVAPIEAAGAQTFFTRAVAWRQYLNKTGMEIRGVVRGVAFPVILAFGVLNMIGNSTVIDQLFGTPVYPVTHLMVNILQSSFLFVFIILTVYSGEIVWRERALGLSEVYDALPIPTWVFWASKLTALSFVLLALLATAAATGVGIQAYHGYGNFELGLYLQGLFLVVGIPLVLAGVLAIALQVLTNHKYLGFLLMILHFISVPALPALDFDHNLYRYANAPGSPYSDMNGYGHFVTPLFWFYLYWSFFAVLLMVFIHAFWVRGRESGWSPRMRIAAQRFRGPVKLVTAGTLVAFVGTGAYIFYNTNALNEYVPGDLQEERSARFEKSYKQYEGMPLPRITAVYADVDIYPERRAVDIRGRYTLANKTAEALASLHLTVSTAVDIEALDIPGSKLTMEDTELGYYIYELERPLAPGEELEMTYDLSVTNPGFVNNGSDTRLVFNGTFFNSGHFFPHLGYTRQFELSDLNVRRKHELEPAQRFPDIDDPKGRERNYITGESDWIDFETVVSTSPGQIAIAPGYLQREWEEEGRRYFHYKMDSPILGFFSYLSADWAVERDSWEDVDIEIYYDRKHSYNVDRMIDGVKKSLDYFTREFGPYQHRQVRIIEFPRYARFAQSFPNTIPFSESIGFIAKLDEEDDEAIDYVFYVTAHEVAHQWWAHQVIGGFNQGSTVMSETMSQYSALMVMEHEYGPEKMRRFLKYELDAYLRGRGGELIEELPLLFVENQGYIHYRKGSLVMYALKDYIGEEALNAALKRYVEAVGFQEPPYTYSREFLSFIEEETPPEYRPLLSDLFENITLYDNRAIEATYHQREDGKYVVRLTASATKFHATGEGDERAVGIDDYVDVAVFGETEPGGVPEGKVLALEKRWVDRSDPVFEIVVDEEPKKAGIDPFNKLVDKNPEDNVTNVSRKSEP